MMVACRRSTKSRLGRQQSGGGSLVVAGIARAIGVEIRLLAVGDARAVVVRIVAAVAVVVGIAEVTGAVAVEVGWSGLSASGSYRSRRGAVAVVVLVDAVRLGVAVAVGKPRRPVRRCRRPNLLWARLTALGVLGAGARRGRPHRCTRCSISSMARPSTRWRARARIARCGAARARRRIGTVSLAGE
jgi:hypothetical protein